MSKNIETYSIIQDRRRDLITCYKEVAPNCVYQHTAWRKVAAHPAKRFYVTKKQVYQRINAYLNGIYESIDGLRNETRHKMYLDLLQVVKDLAQKPENHGLSLMAMCEKAIMQPAPCFYMTPIQVEREFHAIVRKEFDTDGKSTVKTLEYNKRNVDRYKHRYNSKDYWK